MDSIFSSFWLTSTIEAAEPKGLKNGVLRQHGVFLLAYQQADGRAVAFGV